MVATEAIARHQVTVALAPRPVTADTVAALAAPRVPVAPEAATAEVDAAHPVPAADTPRAVIPQAADIPPVEGTPAEGATPVAAIAKDCLRLNRL